MPQDNGGEQQPSRPASPGRPRRLPAVLPQRPQAHACAEAAGDRRTAEHLRGRRPRPQAGRDLRPAEGADPPRRRRRRRRRPGNPPGRLRLPPRGRGELPRRPGRHLHLAQPDPPLQPAHRRPPLRPSASRRTGNATSRCRWSARSTASRWKPRRTGPVRKPRRCSRASASPWSAATAAPRTSRADPRSHGPAGQGPARPDRLPPRPARR